MGNKGRPIDTIIQRLSQIVESSTSESDLYSQPDIDMTSADVTYSLDLELDENIRRASRLKPGTTEWVVDVNPSSYHPEAKNRPKLVTKEADPNKFRELWEKYKEGEKAKGGTLTKVWYSTEHLTDLMYLGGIRPPEEAREFKHTPIEPIGLYAVDRTGMRYLPELLYGTGKREGSIRSIGRLKQFYKLMLEQQSIVSKIALSPDAKVLDAGKPSHWLQVLREFAQRLVIEGQSDTDPKRIVGKALSSGIERYETDGGLSLLGYFNGEIRYIIDSLKSKLNLSAEQEFKIFNSVSKYKASDMSVDLTNHLRNSYDAVRFPDVVITDQENMPQIVLMNRGKGVLKVGQALMPLSIALAAASALLPEQLSASDVKVSKDDEKGIASAIRISSLKAQKREKELKVKFKASAALDHSDALIKNFRRPDEEALLAELAVTKSSGERAWEKPTKAMIASAATTISSFIQGAVPLDVIPEVKTVYDAMDNGVAKLSKVSGIPKPELEEKIGGTTGMLYGIGKMFKVAHAGRAWLGSKLISESIPAIRGPVWRGTLGKTLIENAPELAANALIAGAIGVGYEYGKGELKTQRQLVKTGGAWAATDLIVGSAGLTAPYAVAGLMATKSWLTSASLRYKAFEQICKVTNTVLEKIPVQWAFGGRYGPTLKHWLQPASSRLPGIPGGAETHEEIKALVQRMLETEEEVGKRVLETAKALKPIPEGRRLLYYLMQMDPSTPGFWKVIDRIKVKYGDEVSGILLTQRALSRGDWMRVGEAATTAPWKEVKKPGPKVWMPFHDAPDTIVPPEGIEINEKQAFYIGFRNDENGKYVLRFLQRKPGSQDVESREISTNRDFVTFSKAYDIINKVDIHKSGRWKRTYTVSDIPLLKRETYLKNLETYVPRVFTKYWEDLPADVQTLYQQFQGAATIPHRTESARLLGASIYRFMKKHDLPEDLVEALEPITDMCVLDYQELRRAWNAVHISRTFDSISKRPTVCMTEEAFEAAKLQQGFKLTDWIKVPDIPDRYLKLAGKYLHRDVAEELETLVLPATNADGLVDRAILKWKGWKTIWSPKQHVRNAVSNVILNATVGEHAMPPWGKGFKAYKDMARILLEKDKPEHKAILDEMKANNLFIGTFRHSELEHIKPVIDDKVESVIDMLWMPVKRVTGKVGEKLGRMYSANENWAKGAKYLYLTRHLGIDSKAAAEEAMNSTFNYSDVPLFIRDLRRKWWGVPFVTFTYKAIPAMVESAIKYPWRIGAIELMVYTFNMAAYNALGLNEKEAEELERQLPEYMASGKYAPLPVRDKKNRLQWFDTTFLLPWGIYYTLYEAVGGPSGATPTTDIVKVLWNNPIVATVAGLWTNTKYNGQPIVQSFDDYKTARARQLAYIWEQAVPSLMIGGTEFKSIVDTIRFPESEKTLSIPQQIFRQIGLGVKPMPEKQIKYQYAGRTLKRIQDIRSELRRRVEENPKSADEEIKKAQERLRKLLSK